METIEKINNDPTIFVITPTEDLYDLEKQYERYRSLPIDDMRMSDDKALEVYNKSNEDLYRLLKASMTVDLVTEGFVLPEGQSLDSIKKMNDDIYQQVYKTEPAMLENINKAINDTGYTIVVLYPYTSAYPYTLEELEAEYERFKSLPHDMQEVCNDYCTSYFGMDTHMMYHTQKNIILSLDSIKNHDEEKDKAEIKEKNIAECARYESNVSSIIESTDELTLLKKQLEFLNMKRNGSFLESEIANSLSDNVEHFIHTSNIISDTVPEFTPALTPTEIEDLLDDELTPNAQAFLDEYKKSMSNGLANFDGFAYRDKIQELFSKIQNEKQSHIIKEVNDQLISFGWNPNVAPTDKGFKYARDRIVRYMDENYKIHIMDVSNISYLGERASVEENMKLEMYPIFIILTYSGTTIGKVINAVKKSQYSHACISFNSSLKPMYSFLKHGLSFENFDDILREHPEALCKVIVTFVTKKQKEKICAGAEYYISNHNKTKYDHINLGNFLFNRKINDKYSLKQVCSQFVNQLLTMGNVKIFDKSNNLVAPDDFDKSTSSKLYVVYQGSMDKYDKKKVDYIVDDILMSKVDMTLHKYELQEAVRSFNKPHFSAFEKALTCNESEIEANKILEQMHYLMTPESVLVEAKSLPFKINSKGIIIDLPIRLEEQYQEIHKTMLTYEKEKAYEQMKPELARLWYLNLVSERKIKGKLKRDKQDDAKKIRDTRARIMNDFKKYLKILLQAQPDFDFATYFEGSRYNDRKLFIDKYTLIHSGAAIAKIIKSIPVG